MIEFIEKDENLEFYDVKVGFEKFKKILDEFYITYGQNLKIKGFRKNKQPLNLLYNHKGLDHKRLHMVALQKTLSSLFESHEDLNKKPLWISPIIKKHDVIENSLIDKEDINCNVELHLLPEIDLPELTQDTIIEIEKFNFNEQFNEIFNNYLDTIKFNFQEKVTLLDDESIDDNTIIDIEIEQGESIKPMTVNMQDFTKLNNTKNVYYQKLIGKKIGDVVEVVQGKTIKVNIVIQGAYRLIPVEHMEDKHIKFFNIENVNTIDQLKEYIQNTKLDEEFISFLEEQYVKDQIFIHIMKNTNVHISEKSLKTITYLEKINEDSLMYNLKQSYITNTYGQRFNIVEDNIDDQDVLNSNFIQCFVKQTNLLNSKEEIESYLKNDLKKEKDPNVFNTYKTIYTMNLILTEIEKIIKLKVI